MYWIWHKSACLQQFLSFCPNFPFRRRSGYAANICGCTNCLCIKMEKGRTLCSSLFGFGCSRHSGFPQFHRRIRHADRRNGRIPLGISSNGHFMRFGNVLLGTVPGFQVERCHFIGCIHTRRIGRLPYSGIPAICCDHAYLSAAFLLICICTIPDKGSSLRRCGIRLCTGAAKGTLCLLAASFCQITPHRNSHSSFQHLILNTDEKGSAYTSASLL